MKIRKKKRGSTFVIVIVVMAIIFTTGTTILAVTANDYKMRIMQSKKLQNLYEADSGLDIVENIIIKTSQEAIKYADKEVKKEFTALEDKDRSEKNVNELFKEKFYEFLSAEKRVKGEDGTISGNVKILKHLILSKQSIISKESDTFILKRVDNGRSFLTDILEYVENVDDVNNKDAGITINITSTFQTTEGEFRNEKKVSTTFKIVAPEYNSEITAINIYPVFDGKALTADGNVEVKGGSLTVNGDAWIKGDDKVDNPVYTFDKYKGGIKLENSSFIMNGNIYTANTFHLNNNAESTVNGDLYAKNVYVGKSADSMPSSVNEATFKKNVIVNNDLALNAKDSFILIENNFYGINDKTTEVETANKALNSSSIIVNDTSKTSLIKVNKDSYIMGVAYIDATDAGGNKYQTGESVAVKGNYLAYTDVENFEEGLVLKYYSPLQLLESKNGDSSAAMKADYFAEYYSSENRDGKYTFDDGGVKLEGSVKSVGTSVKNSSDQIQRANINSDDLAIIENQQNEFARNVFAMGDVTGLGGSLYGDQTVKRTVSNQIDFDNLKNITLGNIKEDSGVVILNGIKDDHIKITNGVLEGTSKNIDKGLIITNGDITIEGSFNFTGNIITTGNIIFKDEGEKTITYDPQVVRNVLALNAESLKNIFEPLTNNRVEVKVSPSSESYSADEFLEKSLWKIVK